jgi:RND superfamily putative drug exporter
LFLIARYREELEHGRGRDSAIIRALGHVGEALSGSAFTTMVGLGSMVFAEFGKYRNSGPSIAICLGITLLACLTLAPALLAALGPRVFWPGKLIRVRDHETLDEAVAGAGRFGWLWHRIAEVTIQRPGTLLIAAVVLLAPLGVAGVLRSEPTYDILEELGRTRTSVVGTRMLERHFPAGETSPLTILAYVKSGGLTNRRPFGSGCRRCGATCAASTASKACDACRGRWASRSCRRAPSAANVRRARRWPRPASSI